MSALEFIIKDVFGSNALALKDLCNSFDHQRRPTQKCLPGKACLKKFIYRQMNESGLAVPRFIFGQLIFFISS